MKWLLLEPEDIHQPGDEIWMGYGDGWMPLAPLHFGEAVGDGSPCRRRMPESEGGQSE